MVRYLQEEERINQGDWEAILLAKEAINKVIEEQRNQGVIKGSLGANVCLYYAVPELHSQLQQLGDELRFVLLTSKASLVASEDGG